jgi:hypothetical protein
MSGKTIVKDLKSTHDNGEAQQQHDEAKNARSHPYIADLDGKHGELLL